MPESVFSFILAHQGDAADPELLRWIKVQLDHIFGSGPWAVVAIMGFIILAIPIFQNRYNKTTTSKNAYRRQAR